MPMQPAPAIPPFEPPPLPLSLSDSGRRILWIVSLYRAVCAALLLGTALLIDPKLLNIATPNAFITGVGLYFLFGLASFWWVQQERLPMPLPHMLFGLLVGDVFFLGLIMFAGGGFGAPLPILLFPQLAAAGWLLRTGDGVLPGRIRVDRAAGPRCVPVWNGQAGGAQLFQTGIIGFGYFTTVGIAVALGRYTKQSEDLAAQRGIDVANLEQVNRLIIQDMQDGVLVVDLNGIVRGHNAQVTRLLGGFGRMRGGMRLAEFSTTLHDYWRRWQEDFSETLRTIQGGRNAAPAARPPRAHWLGPERRHADLSRGPGARADRGAANEARRDGPADRVDRTRGAQSLVRDQPGCAAPGGGWRSRRPRARGCSA